jgi:putative flippase GtrA
MPPATPSVRAAVGTLGRHQLGAAAATLVDFGTMVTCVELLGAPPTAATPIGASLGAITNFSLGRAWIFPDHAGGLGAQAARYAVVSAASAGWNALGEHLVHDLGRVQYVLARAIVAFAVSLLWNFPMQRVFVFRRAKAVP